MLGVTAGDGEQVHVFPAGANLDWFRARIHFPGALFPKCLKSAPRTKGEQ